MGAAWERHVMCESSLIGKCPLAADGSRLARRWYAGDVTCCGFPWEAARPLCEFNALSTKAVLVRTGMALSARITLLKSGSFHESRRDALFLRFI